jgi:hypothetical protein
MCNIRRLSEPVCDQAQHGCDLAQMGAKLGALEPLPSIASSVALDVLVQVL